MRASGEGELLSPIARMRLAPLLNTPNVGRTPVLVAIALFAKPMPMAGGLAGVAAGSLTAIALVFDIAVIGIEKLVAITALALLLLGVHRESKATQPGGKIKQNNRREEDQKRRRKKSFSSEEPEENPKEENGISNRRFYGNFIPPLTD